MEILIILAAVVVIGALWYFNRGQKLDANADGKVDMSDVNVFISNAVEGAGKIGDINKDGKVDVQDAKVAVKKAAVKAKSTAKRVTTAAKKATAKKK